jgi:hypothetical protein
MTADTAPSNKLDHPPIRTKAVRIKQFDQSRWSARLPGRRAAFPDTLPDGHTGDSPWAKRACPFGGTSAMLVAWTTCRCTAPVRARPDGNVGRRPRRSWPSDVRGRLSTDQPGLLADDYAGIAVAQIGAAAHEPGVVAHSGAGLLLSAVADALRAGHLVWLAAAVPDYAGGVSFAEQIQESASDIASEEWISFGRLSTEDPVVAAYFGFHDCDLETLRWAVTTTRMFYPEAVYAQAPPPVRPRAPRRSSSPGTTGHCARTGCARSHVTASASSRPRSTAAISRTCHTRTSWPKSWSYVRHSDGPARQCSAGPSGRAGSGRAGSGRAGSGRAGAYRPERVDRRPRCSTSWATRSPHGRGTTWTRPRRRTPTPGRSRTAGARQSPARGEQLRDHALSSVISQLFATVRQPQPAQPAQPARPAQPVRPAGPGGQPVTAVTRPRRPGCQDAKPALASQSLATVSWSSLSTTMRDIMSSRSCVVSLADTALSAARAWSLTADL